MKKIIIIDHEPLTIRRCQIFYIEELIAAGFVLEFWDCSQYFHNGLMVVDSFDAEYLVKMNSLNQIKNAISNVDTANTVFIVEGFKNWNSRKFFKLLKERRCFIVHQEMYATTIPMQSKTCKQVIHRLCECATNPIKLVQLLLFQIYRRMYPVKYNAYICSGDRKGTDLHINHPDWEQYKRVESGERIIDGDYAVFIDEYFPLHPDSLYFNGGEHGIKSLDANKYRSLMSDFFLKMEQKYNLNVVIAAHPKSDYNNNDFGDRKIIKYRSAELIRDSKMVFMHGSSAIAYAIMFNKPIALIYTDDYKAIQSPFIYINSLAATLSLKMYNIEHGDIVVPSFISEAIRLDFIYKYLTSSGIEDSKNADLLIEYFSSL